MRFKWLAMLFLMLCLFISSASSTLANQTSASETAIKAAIIFKLAKFVTWPDDAFENQSERITICFQESDPIGPAIQELSNQRLHGRLLETRLSDSVENPAQECQILIATHPSCFSPEDIKQLTTSPVLTISDHDAFGENSGIITLKLEDNRVQFFIDAEASELANLNIGAQLLQLAKNNSGPNKSP